MPPRRGVAGGLDGIKLISLEYLFWNFYFTMMQNIK